MKSRQPSDPFQNLPQHENLNWEWSIYDAHIGSSKRAWRIAWGMFVLTLLMGIGLLLHLAFVRPVTRVVVDKLTGETAVINDVPAYVSNRNDVNDKFWLKHFVIARERYSFPILQGDYDLVRRLAEDNVWHPYAKQFDGDKPLQKTLKNEVERIPTILSVTLSNEKNLATVRFELVERSLKNEGQVKKSRFVATIEYQYKPNSAILEADLIENPLGFAVSGYKIDPELVTTTDVPVSPMTPAP
ncbi:MAG: type IV secretion system protein [Methylophilaceae bacterium]|nr:type IV secretion system protein [Methylophilaceae bacterium]